MEYPDVPLEVEVDYSPWFPLDLPVPFRSSQQFSAYFLVVCPSIRKAGSSGPAELGLAVRFLAFFLKHFSHGHIHCPRQVFSQFGVFPTYRTHAASIVAHASSQ